MRRRAGAKPIQRRLRSPFVALAVVFSLFVQVLAVAAPQAPLPPSYANADPAAVAAELKAFFGDAAQVCVHIDDKGAPHDKAPCCPSCDQCPLCRVMAESVAFLPPDGLALPERIDVDGRAIRAGPEFALLPSYRAQPYSARAPPPFV